MPRSRLIQVVILLLTVAGAGRTAHAQDYALTVYGGYRDGGSFRDASSDQALDIQGSGAFAISLDRPLDSRRQVQVFVSRQSSELGIEQTAAAPAVGNQLPLTVTYIHVGGTYFVNGPIGKGPYAAGGLGVTIFDLDLSGSEAEVRPSLNLGFGYQVLLGESVGLRFEARWYVTLVDSSGGLFCSGGCVVSIKGDAVTQGEALFGLSFRF